MSCGHHHRGIYAGLDDIGVKSLLSDRRILNALERKRKIDDEHDLPYLGGYSRNGKIIYFDRHLPKTIEVLGKTINPREFLILHEALEKVLIDLLGYSYYQAHRAATGYERMGVTKVLGPKAWKPYSTILEPYIKADEHERLISVPKEIDMTPYLSKPVNRKLLEHMRKAMGHGKKVTQSEAHYREDRGVDGRHCGPVKGWSGDCYYFWHEEHCDVVDGVIRARGGCNLWKMDPKEQN